MEDFIFSESSRCLHCAKPQCRLGCPIGYDITAFLQAAKQGNFSHAKNIVGHIFGEICGSVCPREKQCKGHCILNKKGNPVDVGAVERQVFASAPMVFSRQGDVLKGMKLAVVGGGVSGVTLAELCYRNGADVTIFERNELLNTLWSIPDFRLERSAIRRITDAVAGSGINVVKQNVTHSDVTKLQQQFDFVYLATGVTIPNKMWVEGEEFSTCADDFLRGHDFGQAIVIGGGNTAMDCARLNRRNGHDTKIFYRRTRLDMPAFDAEISAAEGEGVQFFYNMAPVCVQKTDGKLTVTFAKTLSEGRGKLTVTDQKVTVECEILVVATGSKYDTALFPAQKLLQTDSENCLLANIYAGGDATGKSLVVEAVADGIKTFNSILKRFSE